MLLVTKTLASCLPSRRASATGNRGSFVGEGLGVETWGDSDSACSVVGVSDVQEANISTAVVIQATKLDPLGIVLNLLAHSLAGWFISADN